MCTEKIVIREGDMTAVVSTVGAELQSVRVGDREYLYDGSADWTGRAPLLFPFAGRLKGDRYIIDGETYHLPQHGFARRRTFRLWEKTENSVTMLLEDDEETRVNYPARFSLYATYTLSEGSLHASVKVVNRGESTLYFAFGNHEALVADPDKSRYTIAFEKEENLLALDAADGVLLGGGVSHGEGVTTLALQSSFFEGGATLIFGGLRSREVTLLDREMPVLRLRFDTENLLVWCKSPTSPFLCIEPWTCLPDTATTDGDFTRKPGVIALFPDGSHTVSHTFTFLS